MSIILLVVLIGLSLLGIFGLVFVRRRAYKRLVAAVLLLCGGLFFLFRPVCTPLDDETLAGFSPPIELRDDATFYGHPIFQRRDGQWHHCKTWISRLFFA